MIDDDRTCPSRLVALSYSLAERCSAFRLLQTDADRIQSHNCEAVPLVHNEPHPTPFKDLERQLASAKPSNREVRRTFQFGRDLELKESRCERGWRGQRLATSSIRLKCCGGPGGRSWKALGFRHLVMVSRVKRWAARALEASNARPPS